MKILSGFRTASRIAALVPILVALATVAAQPPGAPMIVVSPVVQRTIAATQVFVGTVAPVKRALIGSAVDGRVVEFPVEEGDRVESGSKLAQLMIETISLELAAAEAELDLRTQRLAELQAGSRPEEIEQLRARMAATEARRNYNEARLNRVKGVYQSNRAITEDEYEEAIANAAEATEMHLEAKAAHALAVAGSRKEVIAQARAEVAMQQAVVDRLRDQIQKHTIITRFAGYVVSEHTEVGQWVNRGDPVAEVVALDEVEVVAQVVEQSVPFILPGSIITIEIPAIPGRTFRGKVMVSIPQADSRSRTFPVKVLVKNEITPAGPLLKPGMYARLTLPIASQQNAMLVPKDAIVLGGRQPLVFAIGPNASVGSEGTVRAVPVEIGSASGPLLQVVGELGPDDAVVVEGNERLRPGQPVRIGKVLALPAELPTKAS
ncbi:efflux RND transporter periplasmic adaptor subunit [Botrimarina hoheduenensis]|uniref:Cation efflux system protein CusB n=1 Tax=Botrimarina hoheduenensis TaxID=2528000 RepID=A0A5C5VYM0_9BACT|nr:efflux RND transporter periplasmic adaptor subunit [Botrimarina hoheduenensis]TWT43135.1 Cation efflux system protein CusB precursor [Botrimarina hoheduenensis]